MATPLQIYATSDPTYLLVRNDSENQRLISQARLLNPFTTWVLREAGIREGMKVLDVGSGSGDVALIAADLIGPRGSVVGVDLNPEALDTARSRVREAGLTNVELITGDIRSVELADDFDAVVGRLVLIYVADPTATVRSLLDRLKPDGLVIFQEYNLTLDTVKSWPPLPIWEQIGEWVWAAAKEAGLDLEIGYRLHRIFRDAGLPVPSMQLDSRVGAGPNWAGYDYFADTFRSMLPLVLKAGIVSAEEVEIDTLADRLRAATVAADGAVKTPDLVSAWARKP